LFDKPTTGKCTVCSSHVGSIHVRPLYLINLSFSGVDTKHIETVMPHMVAPSIGAAMALMRVRRT